METDPTNNNNYSSKPNYTNDIEMRDEDDNRAIKEYNGKQNDGYEETKTNPNGFFADLNAAAACSVRVALRVRPLVGRELYESPKICVTCYQDSNQLIIGKDRAFTFDSVFDIPTRQQDVFDLCVKNLVLGCFAGFNATVLAYGQTGSGKTFTMGSGYTIGLKEEEMGIIPRVIKLIFDEVEKRKHKAEFIIKCSFLEIYNEELNDLLDGGAMSGQGQQNSVLDRFMQKKDITIREEKNGNISVFGLKEENVKSYEELAACLDRGSNFRSTASTLMNNCSSRSHAIFTISIEQHVIDDLYQPNGATQQPAAAGAEEFMVAKFHFVDLAGSERAKRTGATGATLKEGISINKGLLALGNVISALTEDAKKNAHVPYRDSKLTRILQDSLGGNSRTSMIACVSPAEVNFEETLNTLKYASRARNIKNKPIVNRDPNSAQIAQLRQQIYELSRELLGARKLLISNNIAFEEGNQIALDMSMLENGAQGINTTTNQGNQFMMGGAEIQRYESEIKDLKQMLVQKDKKVNQVQAVLDTTQEQLSQSRIEIFSVQKERDVSRFQLEQLVQILKKRAIYQDIMKEFHGFNQNDNPMEIDSNNPQMDFVFGSSGPCILEEYQVKVEEQKKELNEKQQQIKQLQKDNEFLVSQSLQDTQNLENKETEIERLKRSNNKLQKEKFQIKNDQRRGTVVRAAPTNQNTQQTTNYNTARKNSNNEKKVVQSKTSTVQKSTFEPVDQSKDWLSKELDYNLNQFNEMFIENLSQSLSSMLVLKKPGKDVKNPNQKIEDVNPLTEIQEDIQDNQNMQDSDSDDQNDGQQDNALEIEHILPQGDKEVQEVIESNEETKMQDEEIKSQLHFQEQQIVNLEDNLKDKESLLQQIKEQHKAMSQHLLENLKNEYHKKVQQFQNEKQQLEQERAENLKKAGSDKQKSQLEDFYKKKLKDLEDKLREAKQKDREQTTMVSESNKQKLRIKSLETEIEKMKSQRVSMIKKMKEESEQHRKWKNDRVKELMQFKQSNLKKDREIQLLKRENQRKDVIAKRKQEELSLLMKKTKLEKQKQINANKDRMKKSNLDTNAIQQWIVTNTEKMLAYKDLQSALEQELYQKKMVEDQITEEHNSYAQLNVKREKLEFRRVQLEQSNENGEADEEIYSLEEEVNQIKYEMKAVSDNIETLEEKFDFIDSKVAQANSQILAFNPDDVEQLKFDQVQSIEGARACLSAFFGILLDVNIYKKQLENKVAQNDATIESLMQQMEELRKIQSASEINFQKQIEQITKEYKEKEDTMIRIIMENGGQELEQMLSNSDGKNTGNHILREYMKQNSVKVEDDTQALLGNQGGLTRRNTTAVNAKQLEIQKNKEQMVTQSKTQLSKRVAELERRTKDDQKKLESLKHQYEQTFQEKELVKKQLEVTKKKLKTQEVQEVKQFKQAPTLDDASNYNSNQPQKSPRNPQAQKMATLNDLRKDRKLKKMGSQNPTNQKNLIEPRVIADEPMDDDDDMIFEKDAQMKSNNFDYTQDNEPNNVFTRLSQLGKGKSNNNASLNVSQTFTQSQIQPQPIERQISISQQQVYEDDGKWKCIYSKELAHNGTICALASVGNQLYSTSNKSLKIWDLEKMDVVSDIAAHTGLIKCMTIWQEKRMLLTASEKVIYLWDMISLTMAGKLTAHKDDIKAMTLTPEGNLIFTAGKGSQNAPGLLVWDLRKQNSPIDEREKNQDIFSLATTHNMLFYGCRSHQVIPFNYRTFEQHNAFEPPHFDAVTSLSLLDGMLVSGSRDKMVRVWDHNKFQHQQVEVAHNDWVNTLETDSDQKEMYSGSKDGMVKVWKMKQGKLKCMAQMQASLHNMSINTISKVDKQFGQMFATGSSDKCLKLFKRKSPDLNTSNQDFEDAEMLDPFDKAVIDKNQDFFEEDQEDYQLFNQINKQEELKQYNQQYQQNVASDKLNRVGAGQGFNTSTQYQSNPGSQSSKLEQKRSLRRQAANNQKRYQKENDQNYQY